MKKLTALLVAVCMAFTLAACSGNPGGTEPETSKPENTLDSASTEPGENSSETNSDNTDSSQTGSTNTPSNDDSTDTVKVLVACFSVTGTTRGVAQTIAESVGADLYEITPEQPYSDADLDYHDDNSRSTIEMNDPAARPAIAGSVEDMEQYDIVFIGYPIWWGEAPRILSTFVESYDFSGKIIVPFCTSGGSGIGTSASNLERLTSGATWLSGTRLNAGVSRGSAAEWINGLGLDITAQ